MISHRLHVICRESLLVIIMFASVPFFSFLWRFWCYHHAHDKPFVVVPQFLGIYFSFFLPPVFVILEILLKYPLIRDSFFSYIQSSNEPIKSILYFGGQCFWSLEFISNYLSEFPLSDCLSIFAFYLLYPLDPLGF